MKQNYLSRKEKRKESLIIKPNPCKKWIFMALLVVFISLLQGRNEAALVDGERLVFDIRYGMINAGEATLNLQKSQYQGDNVWRIFTTAETNSFFDRVFRVRDYIESIAHYDDFRSYVFTKRLNEGRYRQHRIHQNYFDLNLSIYSSFSFGRGEWDERQMEIPTVTYDLLSAFVKVRTMDLVPGQTVEMHVTVDGRNYNALVHVLRKETINTILGRVECLVIEPALEGEAIFQQTGDIHVWITNDDRKIPVLLQSKVIFGHFRATLKAIQSL
ncbi:MAG: DUF3108 domain-containing protein [Candidatus Cloacimonetes bacterium]|nr:DUF3108 domain-containing protein [Candidatus Cloacimonadota bacterium]